jgi:hypothetical protein
MAGGQEGQFVLLCVSGLDSVFINSSVPLGGLRRQPQEPVYGATAGHGEGGCYALTAVPLIYGCCLGSGLFQVWIYRP